MVDESKLCASVPRCVLLLFAGCCSGVGVLSFFPFLCATCSAMCI